MRSHPPLPDDSVDRLFSALVLRYGTPFLDRWRDLDLGVVKADWAKELAGFMAGPINYALSHLPEKPPTVMDFKRLCEAMPTTAPAVRYDGSLRGPTPEERDAMRDVALRIKREGGFVKPGREWAAELIRDHEAGWRNGRTYQATPTALAMARDALRETDTTTPEEFA